VYKMPGLVAGMLDNSCLQPGQADRGGSAVDVVRTDCQEWHERQEPGTCGRHATKSAGGQLRQAPCHLLSAAALEHSRDEVRRVRPDSALRRQAQAPAWAHMRVAGCELPHDASTLDLALPRQAPGQATRAPHRSAQATSPPSRTP